MNNKKLSISDLINGVMTFSIGIEKLKEYASNNTSYGLIARSTPKFTNSQAAQKEWESKFGTPMPNIVEIIKITNATVHEDVPIMEGYMWFVSNILMRSINGANFMLCVANKQGDNMVSESFYFVLSNEPHFATEEELKFIKAHIDKQSNDNKDLTVQYYKPSRIVMIGKTSEINEAWDSIENK